MYYYKLTRAYNNASGRNVDQKYPDESGGLAKQSDGKIVVALGRQTFRLNSDYNSIDTTFVSGYTDANTGLLGIETNSNDEIIIVGNFGTNWTTTAGTITYNSNMYKLNSSGIPDSSWNGKSLTWTSPASEPFDTSARKDYSGKIMIDGFEGINGNSSYKGVIRLNDDFSLDTTFQASGFGAYGGNTVFTCEPLLNGQYLIGGGFQNYSGYSNQDFLVRLNNDGTLDTTFDFGDYIGNQYVFDIQTQSTGKIVIADSGNNVIRLNNDGSVDTTFVSGSTTSLSVYNDTKVLLFPNDYLLIGGSFTTYNSQAYPRLVKTDEDGNLMLCPFASPTPTPSITPTITPSVSSTPSETPTNTPTMTPSAEECISIQYQLLNELGYSVSWYGTLCDGSITSGVIDPGDSQGTGCIKEGTLNSFGLTIVYTSYC